MFYYGERKCRNEGVYVGILQCTSRDKHNHVLLLSFIRQEYSNIQNPQELLNSGFALPHQFNLNEQTNNKIKSLHYSTDKNKCHKNIIQRKALCKIV